MRTCPESNSASPHPGRFDGFETISSIHQEIPSPSEETRPPSYSAAEWLTDSVFCQAHWLRIGTARSGSTNYEADSLKAPTGQSRDHLKCELSRVRCSLRSSSPRTRVTSGFSGALPSSPTGLFRYKDVLHASYKIRCVYESHNHTCNQICEMIPF